MKTVFDPQCRNELVARIALLNPSHQPLWGKMNLYQMLKHNTYWNLWMLGQGHFKYRQEFLGKVFGKIALRRMVKNSKPLDKNVPTSPQFKVQAIEGNLEAEKKQWVRLIHAYEHYNNPDFVHDFFGKMHLEDIGILVYKHSDHHLRQFQA